MALRKRHILLIVALLLAFIGMATAAIYILNGNVISPSESLDIDAYKISGIDVSAHNGRRCYVPRQRDEQQPAQSPRSRT